MRTRSERSSYRHGDPCGRAGRGDRGRARRAGELRGRSGDTGTKPAATEVGVTPTEIHIAVIADVDNPLAPNVFAGARDAVDGLRQVHQRELRHQEQVPGRSQARRRLLRLAPERERDPQRPRSRPAPTTSPWSGPARVLMDSVDDMRNCKDQAGRDDGYPRHPVPHQPARPAVLRRVLPDVPDRIRLRHEGPAPPDLRRQRRPGLLLHARSTATLHGIYLFSSDSQTGYDDQFAAASAACGTSAASDEGSAPTATSPSSAGAQHRARSPPSSRR